MTYVKVDDGIFSHPRMLSVHPLARLLWVAGLCHAGQHVTDGVVPRSVLPILSAQTSATAKHAAQLVDAGLWEECAEGWRIRNWSKHNRTAAEVDAERERWRRQKRGQRQRPVPDTSTVDTAGTPPKSPPGVPLPETEAEAEASTPPVARARKETPSARRDWRPDGPPRIPDYEPADRPDALPADTNATRARQARALARSAP